MRPPDVRRVNALCVLAILALACTGAIDPPVAPLNGPRRSTDIAHLSAGGGSIFYSERFIRTTGAPNEYSRTIDASDFDAPFVIHIRNGDGTKSRVSSAEVTLDGRVLLGESDFSKNATDWDLPVVLGTSAALGVHIASSPGSFIDISLEGHRRTFHVCPGAEVGNGRYATIAAAVADAPAGATIRLCDGVHAANNVALQQALTITSAGPGIATIDGGANPVALNIGFGATGQIKLHKLKLINGALSTVSIGGTYGSIVIDSSEFHPSAGMVYGATTVTTKSGISLLNASGAGVTVRGNTFINGDIGVNVGGASGVVLRNNTFDGQNNVAIRLSDGTPDPGVVLGVVIDSSTFRNCGVFFCLFGGGTSAASISISANTFLVDIARPTRSVVQQDIVNATVTMNDNVITGTGSGGTDRSAAATYPIFNGIRVAGATVALNRNRVTNADQGFTFNVGNSDVTGSDNVIQHVFSGLGSFPFPAPTINVRLNGNDITDYVVPVRSNNVGTSFNVACNYWGANGPQHPVSVAGSAKYLPFVTQPIAGTTGSTCDPNAMITTVRVCSSAGTSSVLTVPTVATAVVFVPSGGTVLVCDGVHSANSVAIKRAITIEAEGPGMPTLDGGSNHEALVIGFGATGQVKLHKLKLINGAFASVSIGGTYGSIVIDSSEFRPSAGMAYGATTLSSKSGISLFNASGAGITIRGNTFIGGDIGVNLGGASGVVLRNNTFDGQNNVAIHLSDATTLTGVVTGVVIDSSTFRNCGAFFCLYGGGTSAASISISVNTFLVDIARPTRNTVQQDIVNATVTMNDNIITGTGSGGTNRSDAATYPIYNGSRVGGATVSLNRNRVTNAYQGFAFSVGNSDVTGSDNVIQHVNAGIGSFPVPAATISVRLNGNDITDYVVSVQSTNVGTSFNVACNYWGGNAPQNPNVAGPFKYLPFVTQPIAGTTGSTCDPNAVIP